MSDVATVPAPATPAAKTPKGKKVGRKSAGGAAAKKHAASHPTYSQMIKQAVQNLKEAKGSSKAAILKYILQHYKVGDNLKQINAHLRLAINRAVKAGTLKQVKGHGASGSFRLGDKKPAAVAKKPAAKKVAKKTASPKKAAAEKIVKKAKKTAASKKKASPKKPKAAATPKKPKTPKKAAKSPAKKAAKKVKKTPKKSPKKAAKK